MRLSRRPRFLGPGESLLGNKTPGVGISEAVSQQTPSDRCAEDNDQEPGSEDAGRSKPAADSGTGPHPTSTWGVEAAKGETGKKTFTTRFQGPQVQVGSRGKEERCGPTQGTAICLTVTRC